MVSILIVCDVDFFGTRFKPTLFNTVFEFKPIFSEAFAGNGDKRKEEETIIELIEESSETEETPIPNSIDELLVLVPEGNGDGLETLTISNTDDKKITITKDNFWAYIFVPNFSQLNVVIDNNPRYIVNVTLEIHPSTPYPRRYTIAILFPHYDHADNYESPTTEPYRPFTETTYEIKLDFFDPRLVVRPRVEDLSAYRPQPNNDYDVFEFRIPEIKYSDVATSVQSVITSEIYLADIGLLPDSRIEDLYRLRAEPISTPGNSIETLVRSEIRMGYEPEAVTEDYVPAKILLEDTVVNIYKHAKVNTLNFPVEDNLDNLIKFPANDNNPKRNQNQNISNIVLQAFSKNEKEYSSNQELVYQEADPDPETNIFPTEAANDNVNNTVQRNGEANYRNPRWNRENLEQNYKKVKTKYKSIIKNLEKKLREISERTIDNISNFSRIITSKFTNPGKNKTNDEKHYSIGISSPALIDTKSGEDKPTTKKLKLEPAINKYVQLENISEYFENKYGCKTSYVEIDVQATEVIASRNANEMFTTGSMSKIGIVRVMLELSQQGRLNLDEEVKVRNSLNPKNYGNGVDEKITYRDLLNEIVKDEKGKSNVYTNYAIDKIGLMRLNKTLKMLGYENTIFVDYYLPKSNYRGNKTSMNDMGRMMFDILTGTGLDEIHHEAALEALSIGKRQILVIRDPNNLDGLDIESAMMKHGQTERDVSVIYRIKGIENGKKYDRIFAINFSDLKQRIVKRDYKQTTSFGQEFLNDFIYIAGREMSRLVQKPYLNQ